MKRLNYWLAALRLFGWYFLVPPFLGSYLTFWYVFLTEDSPEWFVPLAIGAVAIFLYWPLFLINAIIIALICSTVLMEEIPVSLKRILFVSLSTVSGLISGSLIGLFTGAKQMPFFIMSGVITGIILGCVVGFLETRKEKGSNGKRR